MQNKKLNEAISNLARYIPYGELMASTDPVGFIEIVTSEIELLHQFIKNGVENNYICVPDSHYPAKHIVDRLCGKV